jgi:hypothetical protein
MERIPEKVFDEFAAEGVRMSAQHLRDLNTERRHAVLAATVLYLSRHLTDGAIDMFKKLMGILTRRADNHAAAPVTRSVREVQKPLKDVSKVCRAIIKAKEKGEDIAKALEQVVQWPAFAASALARLPIGATTGLSQERHVTEKMRIRLWRMLLTDVSAGRALNFSPFTRERAV